MVKIAALSIFLYLASCSLMSAHGSAVSVSDIQVADVPSDGEVEFCRGFELTSAQVESYFERAEEVSLHNLHDEFDYLPCAVKGTMRYSGQLCKFIIRAGATAEVSCEGDQQFFFGCRSCDDIFRAVH